MSRRTVVDERINELADAAHFNLGEERITLGRLEQAQRNIEALAEARRIERAELVADIEHIRADLRTHEDRLARFDEIDAQCDDLNLEQMRIVVDAEARVDEEERQLAAGATAAGYRYSRPELAVSGAVRGMVERRKQLRAASLISEPEAQVI